MTAALSSDSIGGMSNLKSCKNCGQPIRWVKTRKQKNMPLDPEPDSAGRFAILDPDAETPSVEAFSERRAAGYTGELYQCHFDTCPKKPRRS